MNAQELTFILEGPAHFLDVVYETVEGHIQRTGDEYGQIITGVGAEDAGDVDGEEEAILHLYVDADVDVDEARDLIDLALDRIADENSMDLARQRVEITTEDEEYEEEL